MKLALICTEKLPSPAVKGGAIQLMIDGITPIIRLKHNMTIFSISDPQLCNYENNGNLRYFRFPRENYEKLVAEELKVQKFDVVHVFNRPIHLPLYKQAAPNSKFVLSLHNDMFSELKITAEDARGAIHLVDHIITVSEYIKHCVLIRYPEAFNKITVAYSGINLNEYIPVWSNNGRKLRAQLRHDYQLTGKKVILFVGRLSKTKGPHLLIKSMEKVLAQHEDAVLIIVGGKWFSENGVNKYVEDLHNLAKQYADKIIFTNYLPSIKIPLIFLVADVFVCSSQWHEPLARVHYEAMAAGIPIITTNRGGNAEVITDKENGLVIDRFFDPEQFALAINMLLTNPKLANKFAKNGRELVESRFQYKHVAKRYLNVYEAVFATIKPTQ